MVNLNVSDLRAVVPAKDFALSKEFYRALGWEIEEVARGLALVELGGHRFYLQDYYVEGWADNFVLYAVVADARAWYDHVASVLSGGRFGTARVRRPKREDYGALVTHVVDPSGVLIHFTGPA